MSSESPTFTKGTLAGVILSTAFYMSPEQASGRSVDTRTDIWSFGVVLWEALLGRPLFTGETVSHVLAAVLRDEIDWSAFPAATPCAVRRLLRRCLEREPKRRLQHIGDARIEIHEASNELSSDIDESVLTARPPGWRQVLPWSITTLLVGSVITGLAVWRLGGSDRPLPRQPTRFTISLPGAPPSNLLPNLALSPDGRRLSFVGCENGCSSGYEPLLFYLRSLDRLDSDPIGTVGRVSDFVSLTPFFLAGRPLAGRGGSTGGYRSCPCLGDRPPPDYALRRAGRGGELGAGRHHCVRVLVRPANDFGRRR